MVFWVPTGTQPGGHRQVQAVVPPREEGGHGEVEARMGYRAGEPQGVWGAGQADEQGCSPSRLAQGDRHDDSPQLGLR